MRHANRVGRANYFPNSIEENFPAPSPERGYVSHPAPVSGQKVRARAESFNDHFAQARLFYLSQTPPEQKHIIDALSFELGKVQRMAIRERMIENLARVDRSMAEQVAQAIGVKQVPEVPEADPIATFNGSAVTTSPALSMLRPSPSAKGRKVAILVADGVDGADVQAMKGRVSDEGATAVVVAKQAGDVTGADGDTISVDKILLTTDSVEYDAVYVPGGAASASALSAMFKPRYFVAEAYAHCKPIAASGEGIDVLRAAGLSDPGPSPSGDGSVASALGVVTTSGGAAEGAFLPEFIAAITQHRFWDRPDQDQVPAV